MFIDFKTLKQNYFIEFIAKFNPLYFFIIMNRNIFENNKGHILQTFYGKPGF